MIYPTGHEELLRSDVTQCWEQKKDYGCYTSYVGAPQFVATNEKTKKKEEEEEDEVYLMVFSAMETF
ncbi:hypothetical protein DPMN_132871 [Dreissena polymorpha]|uniref:Uncharacterized protein n=1 Tax=Dreissena polymorpha TaxID=45954 RepID=A0A9D4FVX9_DREPO|nr:hypothetical protein DPMN_132871 [Dreissena polymorpha]